MTPTPCGLEYLDGWFCELPVGHLDNHGGLTDEQMELQVRFQRGFELLSDEYGCD